ncbi:Uncharacterised protein [Buttiauxella agrestis]|uniref:Uncharacterized protein n=1 Tax=Buttiauxella agrestis TaxID=82977 RepID=A0A381KNB3_9ENTR|nr:hypothetical protein [Buttiauxella agrestis]SUY92843.1 Uncharacterised protein [Buttiauxella agrestis]
MPKQITPAELAEMVTCLLVKPELIGELDCARNHQAFMDDIAMVVANYCGGRINGVGEPETTENYLKHEASTPLLSVSPDASLPSLTRNVWAWFDPEGWIDDVEELEPEAVSSIPDNDACIAMRRQFQSLLVAEPFILQLHDWLHTQEECPGYTFTFTSGNQPAIELSRDGETALGLLIEINNGVPALHIDTGGDTLLHIHAAHGGLVLSPDSPHMQYRQSPVDLFSYGHEALLLTACER